MKTHQSPGSNSLNFAKKMDKRILSLKEKQKTREYKKRRIEKKENRLKRQNSLRTERDDSIVLEWASTETMLLRKFQHHLQPQRLRQYHCPKTTITSYLIWKHLEGVISFAGCSAAKKVIK